MKPLNILLANATLALLAGSETWTYTLALQLKEMGHKVSCFSPELGIISDKLIEAGIPCYNDLSTAKIKRFSYVLEEEIDLDFDIIISNHNHIVKYLRSQYPTKPIISTIHGVLHFDQDGNIAPEHPALDAGVAQFVAVSEEVQEKLLQDYGLQSIIIRQPLDTKKLGALKPPKEKPEQFFINTNYAGKEDSYIITIKEVAKHFGAKVAAVGQNFTSQFDLSKAIEESDVVFGMGRSVLEGVAAGRLGIVQGRWGNGGAIVPDRKDIKEIPDMGKIMGCNYSGRNSGGKFATTEEMIEMIEKYYKPEILEWGKNMVNKNHNVILIAEEYVRIARELTGQAYSKPKEGNGVDPLAHKFKLASNA
jgi:hypothetical protein